MLAAAAGGAAAGVGNFVLYSSPAGRFQCEIPRDLVPEESTEGGVRYMRLTPELFTHIDVDVHPIPFLKRFGKGEAGSRYAASLLQEAGADDFQVVKPLEKGIFRGYPAWTITRQYTQSLEARVPRSGKLETRDSYLVIQRRSDFVVIVYKTRPSYFPDHLPIVQHVLDTITFPPEPFWATPRGLGALAVCGALAALALLALLWKRLGRRTSAGSV